MTYFLLCGYPPFDRDSNLEEMQAILVADYSFTPVEFWRGISEAARDFIKRCLTVDPSERMTAHQALQHAWIKGLDPTKAASGKGRHQSIGVDGHQEDLLPVVKKNFNARRTLHKAIDTVRAINKLREGGGLMAHPGDGVDTNGTSAGLVTEDSKPKPERVNGSEVTSGDEGGGQPMDGVVAGQPQLSPQTQAEVAQKQRHLTSSYHHYHRHSSSATPKASDGNTTDSDAMDIDSINSNQHTTQKHHSGGQEQQRTAKDVLYGLWSPRS